MNLDVQTLMVAAMSTLIALSFAIPVLMGRHVSLAARHAQGALLLQTLGWASLVLSNSWWDRPLSTLGVAGVCAGQALMWQSVRGWLGPRPGGRLIWLLAVLTPLGYGLGFDHYAWRVGWSNGGLALQMLTVCLALAWPAPPGQSRWRWLMAASLMALALATAWRGALGALFTDSYPTMRTPHPVNVVAALLTNLTAVLNAVAMLVAWREETDHALRALARTDALTGLLNRRALAEGAAGLMALARRHHDPLALLLIDLDHFKQVNDSRGHAAGDRALRLMADLLKSELRGGDLAGRWGGEEFCVLLARGGADAAAAFDRRLREALARRSPLALGFELRFSTGLATLMGDERDLEPVLKRADVALYAAKAQGRSRLVADATMPWTDPAAAALAGAAAR